MMKKLRNLILGVIFIVSGLFFWTVIEGLLAKFGIPTGFFVPIIFGAGIWITGSLVLIGIGAICILFGLLA